VGMELGFSSSWRSIILAEERKGSTGIWGGDMVSETDGDVDAAGPEW
jgi:hypothetical protein